MKNLISSVIYFVILNSVISQKVNVTIFYESLCSDSLNFINNQLYPNWGELSPYVNLDFIPFGKSESVNGGPEFKCQHGPIECAGNKIQSCVLHALEDTNTQVEFVHCFMNTFNKIDVGQSCAAQIGINWNYVEQCYNTKMGTHLQLTAEQLTKQISPKFVPTVVYNRIFDQTDQNDSQNNFKTVVCKHLNRIQQGICQTVSVLQV